MKEDTVQKEIEDVIKLAKEKNRHVDSRKIMKAYNYAKAKHRRSKKNVR